MPAPSRLAMGGMHATYALSESARYATEQAEKERQEAPSRPEDGTRFAVVTERNGRHHFKAGAIGTVVPEDGFGDSRSGFPLKEDVTGLVQRIHMSDVVPVC